LGHPADRSWGTAAPGIASAVYCGKIEDHPAMPRFYFHLTDGKHVLNNHKGIDLSGNAAAREDALALARDLKHGAAMPGWNWTGWFVAIVDQHGHKVDEVPIADV
jgi:Domain of unknown function (DUF6894)